MEYDFESILQRDTGLSLEDLPDRNPGYYDNFMDEDGKIDYDALAKE